MIPILLEQTVQSWFQDVKIQPQDFHYLISGGKGIRIQDFPHPWEIKTTDQATKISIRQVSSHKIYSELAIQNEPLMLTTLIVAPASANTSEINSTLEVEIADHQCLILLECHLAHSTSISSQNHTHVKLGKNARLQHYIVKQGDPSTKFNHSLQTEISENSFYECVHLCTHGKHNQSKVDIALTGHGARCHFKGGLLPTQQEISSLDLTIHHHASECTSHALVRTAAFDQGRASFKGRVINHVQASASDIHLENKCLLLSSQAEAMTKPEFEIYNDCLRSCTHGATVGHLNEDALFYLESRGIPRELARKLLVDAFLQPLYDKFSLPLLNLLLQQCDPTSNRHNNAPLQSGKAHYAN